MSKTLDIKSTTGVMCSFCGINVLPVVEGTYVAKVSVNKSGKSYICIACARNAGGTFLQQLEKLLA